jgi:hypothetical protein
MMIDYKQDLNWDYATVTPLGRFYSSLGKIGVSSEERVKIIHALTESGVYSMPSDIVEKYELV